MLLTDQPLQIYVGYDSAEPIAYHVCCQSILDNTSHPVSFFPLGLKNKPRAFDRPRGDKDSTEFAITRFLVPYLSNFMGYSIFMEVDPKYLKIIEAGEHPANESETVAQKANNWSIKI